MSVKLVFLSSAEAAQGGPSVQCVAGEHAYIHDNDYHICVKNYRFLPAPSRPPSATSERQQRRTVQSGADGSSVNTCDRPRTWDVDVVRNTVPPSARPAGAKPGTAGRWVFATCAGKNEALAAEGGSWVWTGPMGAAAGAPAPPLPDPGVLAQEAFEDLRPSAPVIDYRPRFHPQAPESTLVGLRTFLWADRGSLQPASRRASAGPNWAEVTASVQSVSFEPGDGSAPAVCPNGGTPYNPALSDEQQTADCWHVFTRPSSNGPFQLRATVTWAATWTGSGGTGGVLPMVSTTTVLGVTVQELQVVNRAAGRP
ncbi:hypothetical protein [Frankia sp. AgKG'84/4]|uniref:hypothetical protein n=1 Tax=Frankia sp. AgKG'84/4 TaxID=573490 RepID=UPI00202A8332|nr:hypothetical protein [Frankia sp. AgKG'84/4]MCL9793866.1 hypothetical protein [Frankia sp. AgKG'84/4]